MTRSHLGASRRLPPRITMLSTPKYKWKEERKRVLKLSVKKLRSIEDPEAFLSRSVLINNTLKRLQTEVREEKSIKKANAQHMMYMSSSSASATDSDLMTSMTSSEVSMATYSPSPYSFYSIEKAYREEVERLDNNNGMNNQLCSTTTTRDNTSGFVNHHVHHHHHHHDDAEAVLQEDKGVLDVVTHPHDHEGEDSSHMFEADDEASEDSEEEASVTSGSEDSSESASEDENEEVEQRNFTKEDIKNVAISDRIVPSSSSLEDELLSDMPPPSLPPPPQMMLEEKTVMSTSVGAHESSVTSGSHSRLEAGGSGIVEAIINNTSAEAVMKSSEYSSCDNEDLYSEAVRTECWTKPSTPPTTTPTTTTPPSPPSTPPTTLSTSSRTTSPLSSTSSAVNNTWPNLEWPTYVPSMTGLTSSPMTGLMSTGVATASTAASVTSFSPNISAVPPSMCSSHKENLFQMPNAIVNSMDHHRSSQIEKCYSCAGQASSLFQSEFPQNVSVFNSLITSLET